ncbi:AAA family ATPase [Candidatus Parcubacteria bacterium]|nr:MAG: AAA family ATPase [Candidatus Parcubacteria bacterium]
MVVGHERQLNFLKEAFIQGNLGHANLFRGPEAVGKKNVAKELATFMFCEEKKKVAPCGKCNSCRFGLDKNQDFIFIGEASEEIKIGDIRFLKRKLSFKSSYGGPRIILIDNAHLLNQEAANALLKTLEEPYEGVYFFLVTSQPEKLPDTIISRVASTFFGSVPSSLMTGFYNFSDVKVNKALLKLFVQGRPGLVFNFKTWLSEGKGEKIISELLSVFSGDKVFSWNEWKKFAEESESGNELSVLVCNMIHLQLLDSLGISKDFSRGFSYSLSKVLNNNFFVWAKEVIELIGLIQSTNVNSRIGWEKVMWKLPIGQQT